MYDFTYIDCKTLNETLKYLSEAEDYALIAGGTDLMIQYRSGKQNANNLVNVLIPELMRISEDADAYHIGASVFLTQLSDFFAKVDIPYRVIHRAAESVGSCQTRNLGTVGGNICTGNASSDMAAAFLVLDAAAVAASSNGVREIPMDEFFVRNRCTAIQKGELLTEIRIPKEKGLNSGAVFKKLGKRRGHVIATLNVAARIDRDDTGTIRKARLAGGTLAPRPIRFPVCEELLIGCNINGVGFEETLDRLEELMETEMQPRDSKRGSREYRINASKAVMRDAITEACGKRAD